MGDQRAHIHKPLLHQVDRARVGVFHTSAKQKRQPLSPRHGRLKPGPVIRRNPDQNHPRPGPDGGNRSLNSRIVTGHLEHHIHPLALCRRLDLRNLLTSARQKRLRRAHRPGRLHPVRHHICGNHLRRPRQPRQLDDEQADGPAPEHPDPHPRPQMRQIDRMDGHAQQFQHGAVRIGQRIRQRKQVGLRPRHHLTQRPILLAVPGKPLGQAEIRIALQAKPAPAADNRRVHGHPFALPVPLQNHRGKLMPQHQRLCQLRIPNARLGKPVQIRSAQPDGRHLQQRLARPGDRGILLDKPHVAYAVQSNGLHLIAPLSASVRDAVNARYSCGLAIAACILAEECRADGRLPLRLCDSPRSFWNGQLSPK